MSGKSKRTPPPKPKPGSESAEKIAITKWRSIVSMVKAGILGVSVPLSILAVWPLAAVLAGKTTAVNVTVAITLTIALTITNGVTGAWGYQQKKKARHARARLNELEPRMVILGEENESLRRRNEALERQVPLTRQKPAKD
ncbi:hypothetical protein EV580_1368 [Mycobacterium sp. BK086]|uniref:hypothetical protein n=1 Tax=Mycobacterium sp. BK086 TaxID=2512165 RepID=UPI00105E7876|nr:hypothetical protein [Mycobacterium sp. BK086]TDO18184.1 hypothetical protein EV580_1368 [Mycobacterium sp. BK086]